MKTKNLKYTDFVGWDPVMGKLFLKAKPNYKLGAVVKEAYEVLLLHVSEAAIVEVQYERVRIRIAK